MLLLLLSPLPLQRELTWMLEDVVAVSRQHAFILPACVQSNAGFGAAHASYLDQGPQTIYS